MKKRAGKKGEKDILAPKGVLLCTRQIYFRMLIRKRKIQ